MEQSDQDRIANLEEQIIEMGNQLSTFAQIVSGLLAAITVAFESHTHSEDNDGKVELPDEVIKMYQQFIPDMRLGNDNG